MSYTVSIQFKPLFFLLLSMISLKQKKPICLKMLLQSNKLAHMLYIHNNSPTPLWKIARVPSARATNTIPFTCLQTGMGILELSIWEYGRHCMLPS